MKLARESWEEGSGRGVFLPISWQAKAGLLCGGPSVAQNGGEKRQVMKR